MHVRHSNRLGSSTGGIASIPVAAVIGVVLLIAAGKTYRVAAKAWGKTSGKNVSLPVPLTDLPRQIGGWAGVDVNIGADTREYMKSRFADDYVNRQYINKAERFRAEVYVVYCSSRPSAIIGHKPQSCYPGFGYEPDGLPMESEFTTQSGRRIPCLIHSFHKPAPAFQQIYVLNFYVINGRIALREEEWESTFGRSPNLGKDPARYVAQIQISSSNTESPARALAHQLTDTILSFLPDQDGHVAAAQGRVVDSPQTLETAESNR